MDHAGTQSHRPEGVIYPEAVSEDVGTGALPSPLSHFATRLDEVRSADAPDMNAIGRLLVELAADDEFFGPLIADMAPASMDVHWLLKPDRGDTHPASVGMGVGHHAFGPVDERQPGTPFRFQQPVHVH